MIGKNKFPFVQEGLSHYLEQIGHMASVEYLELKDQESSPEKEAALIQETLERRKFTGSRIFLLDDKGKAYSSEAFAKELGTLRDQGVQRFVFVIGGAYGFAPEFRAKFPLISLSKMTFPHDLVRLILAEQIYRALHILSGGKYHHG